MFQSELEGKAHKFGDDINTDYIIPGKYLMNVLDSAQLATHAMEGVDPNFHEKISDGDIIVAGNNFGCGSSREEAPQVIKEAGIGAVVAKSFARIFYRNAINIGLPILECDTDPINQGDTLQVSLEEGTVNINNSEEKIETKPLPESMRKILRDGGMVKHLQKHGTFQL